MLECKKCRVSVDVELPNCPLCGAALSKKDETPLQKLYPVVHNIQSNKLGMKLLAFLSVAVCLICVAVNVLTWHGRFWSAIPVGAVCYMWVTLRFMVKRWTNIGRTLIFQVIGISLLLVIIDVISGFHNWSLNYVIPFLIMGAILAVTVVLMGARLKWREYLIYQLVLALLGFIPFILLLTGWVTVPWTAVSSAVYGLLTLIGTIIFADKKVKNEVIKRFHF